MQQLSVYSQIQQQLESRMAMYDHYGLSLQSHLFTASTQGIKTISDRKGQYACYDFQTSINSTMKPIYQGQTYGNNYQKKIFAPLLEPPSEGEESITEQITQKHKFQPSFQWLVNRLIDSNLLEFDTPEPQKVDYSSVSQNWQNIKDLILFGLSKRTFTNLSNQTCNSFMIAKLQRFSNSIKFKKCQQIFHQGKQCLLLRFKTDVSAQFAYYNISKGIKIYQQYFGFETRVGRVTSNKLKEKKEGWVAMVLRKLPKSLKKDHLFSLLKNHAAITWIEDIVEVEGLNYALVGVETLEDVFKTIDYFKNHSGSYRELGEIKVNLHPQSKKIWPHNFEEERGEENQRQMEYEMY